MFGAANASSAPAGGLKAPSHHKASAPTASAPMSGGSARASRGAALKAKNAAVIGAAIHSASRKARTRSTPKRRNTPATIAMTIGIGTASMARRTQPESPSTSISRPVAWYAPITSAKLRCPSAGPTSTAPGIVQKKTSGWRYSSEKPMLSSPFRKKLPNSQEARSDSDSPPRAPTARMMATGPLAANRNATMAFAP